MRTLVHGSRTAPARSPVRAGKIPKNKLYSRRIVNSTNNVAAGQIVSSCVANIREWQRPARHFQVRDCSLEFIVSLWKNCFAASWRLVFHIAACDYSVTGTIQKNCVAEFELSEGVFRSSVSNTSTPGGNARLIDHPLVSACALWFGFVRVAEPIGFPSVHLTHDFGPKKDKENPVASLRGLIITAARVGNDPAEIAVVRQR